MDELTVSAGVYGADQMNPLTGQVATAPNYFGMDVAEAQKIDPYTAAPAGSQGDPWWSRAIMFGIGKVIDNKTAATGAGMNGNVHPGSFPGYNGKTYSIPGQGSPIQLGNQSNGAPAVSVGLVPLLLVAGAALVFMAIR